jgi:DNA polymerase-3 subunit delta'
VLFKKIPGLSDTKKLLTEAVRQNHTAHAQLFVGAEGALNLPLALAFATYLHCENRAEQDACGVCRACSKNLKFIHPDTHFVFPLSNIKGDKDEERFKAEITKSWRSFLLDQPFGNLNDWTTSYGGEDKQALISRDESREIIKTLSLKPFESPCKVMIIWQPELMHSSAANGILKILEEPASHTYFILVTNAADSLLPTIISRTQIISVPLLDDKDIEQHLIVQGLPSDKARRIAQLAEGNMNHALRLSESEEDDNATRFIEWMRACFKKSYGTLVALSESYHALDKMSQKNLMVYSMNVLRETLLTLSGAGEMNRLQNEELKFVQDFSKVMSVEKIDKSFSLMSEATYHLERNGSAKMIFLDLSLKLSNIIKP